MTIKDVSRFEGPPYDSTLLRSGDGIGLTYTNWDANSLTACDCDGGFFGADCSLCECAVLYCSALVQPSKELPSPSIINL